MRPGGNDCDAGFHFENGPYLAVWIWIPGYLWLDWLVQAADARCSTQRFGWVRCAHAGTGQWQSCRFWCIGRARAVYEEMEHFGQFLRCRRFSCYCYCGFFHCFVTTLLRIDILYRSYSIVFSFLIKDRVLSRRLRKWERTWRTFPHIMQIFQWRYSWTHHRCKLTEEPGLLTHRRWWTVRFWQKRIASSATCGRRAKNIAGETDTITSKTNIWNFILFCQLVFHYWRGSRAVHRCVNFKLQRHMGSPLLHLETVFALYGQ